MAKSWRGFALSVLLLAVGGLLGVAATSAVLYKRPFVDRLDSVKRLLGLGGYWDLYKKTGTPFGRASYSWKGVQSPTSPEWTVKPGFDVQLVAQGFTYPVSLAFPNHPGTDPDSPRFYVAELDGRIKYVGNDGQIYLFAEGFKNVPPFPIEKSDELGLVGLTTLSDSDDLVITHAYKNHEAGFVSNRIVRLISEPGGKRLRESKVLLDLKEPSAPSHQIQSVIEGPDGKLYVSVGDGEDYPNSLNLSRFGGKILRMNKDGSPCDDNPFYDEIIAETNPQAPRLYIYALGIRNAFDLAFQPDTGRLYSAENGESTDRLIQVLPGASFGYDGIRESSRLNALFTWGPDPNNVSPVGMVFPNRPILGDGSNTRGYMGLYGDAFRVGPDDYLGKSIVELEFDPKTGLLLTIPALLIQYSGDAKATVLDLAEGPDGLYFTDFFGSAKSTEVDGTGRVWRVVPSKETLGLPSVDDQQLAALEPAQRGQILFHRNCIGCHSLNGSGGHEGPRLDGIAKILESRLAGHHEAAMKQLLKEGVSDDSRRRIEEVLAAKPGKQRVRTWLKHHLEEPRFDNLYGKMPSFAESLSPEYRNDVIAFLMSQ
ncbi:MAG: glucose dehydrogenase [Isosphaeraceae bacterium]|jgi:mono/diheme cytochrome c family protein|nr:MAG: glucose dehydrogenase [Isosphaeraceae bacterium]